MQTILKPLQSVRAIQSVDIMCNVIDNYGDAGVCLRLARTLVGRYGLRVRLVCDDLALLHRLQPHNIAGLSFVDWSLQAQLSPSDAVISGFGCELDPAYLQAMANRKHAGQTVPAWLDLEYLSAESWVEGVHGLKSIHPQLLMERRFCAPGFTAATGGVLKADGANVEQANIAQQPQFETGFGSLPDEQALTYLKTLSVQCPENSLRVLMFAYDYAPFAPLLAAARHYQKPITWLLCPGAAAQTLAPMLQKLDQFTVVHLPFVPQSQFDTLLRCAHRVWVRGEDSAVRAMWAGVPAVWQLYAQQDNTHHIKLAAYLERMQAVMPSTLKDSMACVHQVHLAANGCLDEALAAQAWFNWLSGSTELNQFATAWQKYVNEQVPDLAQTVYRFLTKVT